MEKKLKIGSSLGKIYRTVWHSIRRLLIFGLVFALIVRFVIKPVLRLIFSLVMRLKGYSVLINADIAGFFTSISGILLAVGLGVLASICVYYEFATLLHILKTGKRSTPASLVFSMEKSVFSLASLKSKETIGFILYSVVLLPFFSLGMAPTLLSEVSIPNFMISETIKHSGGELLLVILALAGTYLFIRLFYIFPIMVFEEKTFFKACRQSIRMTKKSTLRTFVIALLSVLTGIIIMLVPTVLFMQLRGWISLPFKAASFLLLVAASTLIPALSVCASLTCYEFLVPPFKVEQQDLRVQAFDSDLRKLIKKAFYQAGKFITWIKDWFQKIAPTWLRKRPYIILIVILIPVILLSDLLIPLTFETQGMIIVGHRGSQDGVENTTEAIQGAINQGADYAEIDVLLSADHVPMVIHDYNLFRLTGESLSIYNLTAEELGNLPLQDRGLEGKISTLAEVCDFSKGKIKLLIEYKTHGKEQASIVDKTVEVIRSKGMESEIKYQTLEQPLLDEMRMKYPEYPMGFIIVGHFGTLSSRRILRMNADFLGVEESQVNEKLIQAAHRAGKPIYVWTVNDAGEAKKYSDLDVDGIITDYPLEMREALTEEPEEEISALEKLTNNIRKISGISLLSMVE